MLKVKMYRDGKLADEGEGSVVDIELNGFALRFEADHSVIVVRPEDPAKTLAFIAVDQDRVALVDSATVTVTHLE